MSGTRNVSLAGAVVLSVLALVSCPAASPPVSPPPGTLQVFQGSTELTSGTGYNYGTCIDLSSTAATFTVKNNTSATVNLNATTPYVVAGTDATDFHLTAVSGTRVLASGASATFDVSFAPSRTGAESATLTVNCSSGNVSLPLHGSGTLSGTSYTITDLGTGKQVNPNDTVAFATMSTLNGNPVTRSFQIENTGAAPLGVPMVGATVTVTPDTDLEFGAALPPPGPALPVGAKTSFGVSFLYTNKGAQSYTDTVTVYTSSTTQPTFTFKVTGIQTRATNTYLLSPSLSMAATPAVCTGGNYSLSSGTNPFDPDAAVVFIGGAAPRGTSLKAVYCVTGSGTSTLSILPLTGGTSYGCTTNSDYGTTTIYAMDWDSPHLGAVTPAANGEITVTNHGLAAGDTVYIAGAAGPNLTSGAYVVATAPDANTFTLQGITLTTSDSFDFLAKVNATPGAVPF